MEEPVRADQEGRIIPALAESFEWLDANTLEMRLHSDVYYQNGEYFDAKVVLNNFEEVGKWAAPHPPGTWLNLFEGTVIEQINPFTVRFHFPKPDGLVLGKFRAQHLADELFWRNLGFGYKKLGSGEGHW
ncbi:ABC transporter substrate-binding protein [Filobacillus milosensis]|uniref:ABC transporter substrate-binding protein n=2 Tax=Filobacillus milosensis TaxID=94137 RepID=A0A4Y8IGX1_9BACI|nr:ABC transporter substrate-binding protein [Filobacillus milosensis]